MDSVGRRDEDEAPNSIPDQVFDEILAHRLLRTKCLNKCPSDSSTFERKSGKASSGWTFQKSLPTHEHPALQYFYSDKVTDKTQSTLTYHWTLDTHDQLLVTPLH